MIGNSDEMENDDEDFGAPKMMSQTPNTNRLSPHPLKPERTMTPHN